MKTVIFILALSIFGSSHPTLNNLTGRTWSLVKITDLSTNQAQFSSPDCITNISFDQAGDYLGFSAGNNYRGSYFATSDNRIAMNSPGHTRYAGDPKCKLNEKLYEFFPKTKSFTIRQDTLILLTDSLEIAFWKN